MAGGVQQEFGGLGAAVPPGPRDPLLAGQSKPPPSSAIPGRPAIQEPAHSPRASLQATVWPGRWGGAALEPRHGPQKGLPQRARAPAPEGIRVTNGFPHRPPHGLPWAALQRRPRIVTVTAKCNYQLAPEHQAHSSTRLLTCRGPRHQRAPRSTSAPTQASTSSGSDTAELL